jgi:UDP-N-acetylmuramyl pentapeptide phosphotransferase/UDP-N-acetylglucosamine-1-phosphate transferase
MDKLEMMITTQVLLMRFQGWILMMMQGSGMEDPGMPGGGADPDLPETPLDSGVFFLIVIALVYGLWQIRKSAGVVER